MLPEGELQSAVCQAGLAFAGISAGLLVSGGVFTVLLSVGLAPRFAGVTHTGNRIFLYEEMVVFGTLFGNVLSVFEKPITALRQAAWPSGTVGRLLDASAVCLPAAFGLFAGIFVGCLALAIAEMLDSIPVFARRISFRRGLGIAILCVAAGKLMGSLYYFLGGF